MTDDPKLVELVPFEPPFETFIRELQGQPDGEGLLTILRAARSIAAGEAKLDEVRETARREWTVSPDELQAAVELSERAAEESYREQYALLEVIQAAAVGVCDLVSRTVISGRLAVAAKLDEKLERARLAYADTVEGLQILNRFFERPDDGFARAEESMRAGWEGARSQAGAANRDLLDSCSGDPADEWSELVKWNSDLGENEGLLAQVDATLRLAQRFQHCADSGLVIGPIAERMLARSDSLRTHASSLFQARTLATLGDALMEIGEWPLGAKAHEAILERTEVDEAHPLSMHAAVQGAYCHLMTGDADGCRAKLQRANKDQMARLADLVVTVAAELARFHAVEASCRRRTTGVVPDGAEARVASLLERVSIISSRQPADRVEYLRTLFFVVLAHDVQSILQSGQ